MPAQARPVSRRWWLRISVRGLLVAVLLVGGWLGWLVHTARIQHDAVAAITSAGGFVYYDWEREEWDNGPKTGPRWAPRWLVDRLGLDYFGHVIAVRGCGRDTDAVMSQVSRLRQLEVLHLNQAPLTDRGLAQIKGLTHLASLYISGTHVTDSGLVHLKGLTSLKDLECCIEAVTDDGIACLEGLTGLDTEPRRDLHYRR
jgi:internalin A